MERFESLWQESLARAATVKDSHPIALDPAYARATRDALVLETAFWQHGSHAQTRSVYIHAPKIEILNIFVFPEPDWAGPLYAMEFVALGGKPIVAVLEVLALSDHPPLKTSVEQWLTHAHQLAPMANDDAPPPWYQACRSGRDFFVRPARMADFAPLAQAHRVLWESVLAYVPTPTHGQAKKLREYQQHHAENSPGRVLLAKSFGEDWTEYFLRNILFG